MPNQQVKDVLDSTRKVHERAHTYFGRLAEQSSDTRTQMLLGYLSDHEQHLANAIREIEDETSESILTHEVDTQTSAAELADHLDWDEANKRAASTDALTALGLDVNNQIIELLSDLAERAEPEFIREIFQSLLEMEQQEEKLLATQTLRGTDL